jgi:hypothetical protein
MIDAAGICIDEIMSAWKSKTTTTGHLPNITFEPRKPKDMGTMFKAIACGRSGVMRGLEICESGEAMAAKKYFEDSKAWTSAGNKSTACTRRLADLTPAGSHIHGDSWFGCVQTAVELKKDGRDFSCIVKGKSSLFCKDELIKRGKELKRGEWVCAETEINGVKLIAVVYRFSHKRQNKTDDSETKGLNLFLTTAGFTTPGELHHAHWVDENDCAQMTPLPRCAALSVFFNAFPAVDKHDHARQSKLAVEEAWLTRDPWFRLHTTFTGICMVDLWKICMELQLIEPAEASADHVTVREFVDQFTGAYLRPAEENLKCQTCSFGQRETDNSGSSKSGKKAKTSSYSVRYACMICKTPTTQYCSTFYPMGGKEGAVCGDQSGRDCLQKHAARVLLGL